MANWNVFTTLAPMPNKFRIILLTNESMTVQIYQRSYIRGDLTFQIVGDHHPDQPYHWVTIHAHDLWSVEITTSSIFYRTFGYGTDLWDEQMKSRSSDNDAYAGIAKLDGW